MDTQKICDLIAAFNHSNIEYLSFTEDGVSFEFKWETPSESPHSPVPSRATLKAPSLKDASIDVIKSPVMGLFHHHHPFAPGTAIELGGALKEGEIVGYIEIPGSVVPVISNKAGILKEYVAANEAVVGYCDPLILVELS